MVTGITNVIFTSLAMFVVDRWGRKALTLIGSVGLAVIYAFMGAAYYFHITGAVSYKHLDVYKRQPFTSMRVAPFSINMFRPSSARLSN